MVQRSAPAGRRSNHPAVRTDGLGQFLRARRALADPSQLGLPVNGRARPGLRREEVAMLAGVSTPYYTRLEQGHDRHPSDQVVEALARVLALDPPALDHLKKLAAIARPDRALRGLENQSVTPQLQRLLDAIGSQPAVVVGRYRDVLAANDLARLLNEGFEPGRNLIEHTFVDPSARQFYVDWEDVAEGAVAGLRASAGVHLGDPVLQELVEVTSRASREFAELWDRHEVGPRTEGRKRYRHPGVGLVTLDYDTFTVTAAPDQILFVFHARANSVDEQALRLLRKMVEDGVGEDRTASS